MYYTFREDKRKEGKGERGGRKKEGKEKRKGRNKRETRSDGAREPKREYNQKPMNKMAFQMIT